MSWQTNRSDKAQEFFAKQASELQNQAEWKDWFVLPFLPSPDTNPTFATYFSRQWADTFIVSLHNFLSVLFQCMHILSVAGGLAAQPEANRPRDQRLLPLMQSFLLQNAQRSSSCCHVTGLGRLVILIWEGGSCNS